MKTTNPQAKLKTSSLFGVISHSPPFDECADNKGLLGGITDQIKKDIEQHKA